MDNDAGFGCDYQHTTPRVFQKNALVALGDSLTFNQPNWAASFWPVMLQNLFPSWTVTNGGFPAWHVAQGTTRYADGGWFLNPPQYVSMEFGINDSAGADYSSPASAFFFYKQQIETAAVVSTPLLIREGPFYPSPSWTPTIQTYYDSFQTKVAAYEAITHFPYVDEYDGGMLDSGTGPPALNCSLDYDLDGVSNVCTGAASGHT